MALRLRTPALAALLLTGLVHSAPAQSAKPYPAPQPTPACPEVAYRPWGFVTQYKPEEEITLEIRFVNLPNMFVERIGIDFEGGTCPECPERCKEYPGQLLLGGVNRSQGDKPLATLDDRQVSQFLEAVQGDRRANVMQAPKMTLFNGQSATLDITDTQYFVTGVHAQWNGKEVVAVPQKEAYKLGVQVEAQPVLSPDRGLVHVNLRMCLTELESGNVPASPVTSMVTPVFEGGAVGQPVPFTQYIQQPKVNKIEMDRTLHIPAGRTVVLGGWQRTREERHEFGPPVLSKIPYVNRMFKNTAVANYREHVFVMVTPRVQRSEIGEARATARKDTRASAPEVRQAGYTEEQALPYPECRKAPAPERVKKLQDLLQAYQKACGSGRLAEAQQLAEAALALDPSCFMKR